MDNTNSMVPKSGPKDVFYHLLAIATLYMSAVSFIALVFQLINTQWPDSLSYSGGSEASIRWSASILIVAFPVYLLMNWLIGKDVEAEPLRREIRVRKWLDYLTLFISAVTVIGDVIALIYNFLGGELSIRFYLNVLAVLVTAGLIFLYYLKDTRNKAGGGV